MDAFRTLMIEVVRRIEGFERVESRYENMLKLAGIYQEFGNRLSRLVYADERKLACASGCSTCCLIPSSAYESASGTFAMTVLDMLTLIEHYSEMKSIDGATSARAMSSVEEARKLKEMIRCPHLTSAGTCGIYNFRPVACKIWFSADLELCIRNRVRGYTEGANPITDESNRLRESFERPFLEAFNLIAPDMTFRGHDFLLALEEIAKLDVRGLFDTLKEKIDAHEQNEWDPFA
jgi:hypothetical protein